MGLKDDHAAGCAIASFETLRSLLTLLVMQKTIPKELTLALLDQALERIEKLQAADAAQSGGKSVLTGPMQAARFQMTTLLEQLRLLPDG